MENEYQIEGNRMVWRMPVEVDHHRTEQITKRIEQLIESRQIRTLVFDFAKTVFMDSSGIGLLIGRSRTMRFYGGQVKAIHLNGRAEMLFEASGLSRLIEKESLEEE